MNWDTLEIDVREWKREREMFGSRSRRRWRRAARQHAENLRLRGELERAALARRLARNG